MSLPVMSLSLQITERRGLDTSRHARTRECQSGRDGASIILEWQQRHSDTTTSASVRGGSTGRFFLKTTDRIGLHRGCALRVRRSVDVL